MNFIFLDARKREIATYYDHTLIDGVVRRELVDRMIKDSVDMEFTLNMLPVVKDATYILLGDTEWFRTNPVFKISDLAYDSTVRVTALSQTLDRANEVGITWDKESDILTLINRESAKIGFEIEVRSELTDEELTVQVADYIGEEFKLSEIIEVITQLVDGTAEFDTILQDDFIAKTKLIIATELGKDYKDALIYGHNITDIKIDERVEGIVTAVEYTGFEYEDEEGNPQRLTLERTSYDIPRNYTLPYTNRRASLTEFEDSEGNIRYLLEDVESTRVYGHYTEEGEAEPIIESYSNTDIPTIEDLIDFAIRELDGKSVPETKYSISASVSGLDVSDNLGIKVPHLEVDRTMPVLTVMYDMRGDYETEITVGDHLPTEVEKQFEKLATLDEQREDEEKIPIDTERGEKMADILKIGSIFYTSEGLGRSDTPVWVSALGRDMYPDEYDYFLEIDYKMNEGYSGGVFDLVMTYQDTHVRHSAITNVNGLYTGNYTVRVVNESVEGKEGTLSIRLNDYHVFMNAPDYRGISSNYGSGEGLGMRIGQGNYVLPYFAVTREATGELFYLQYKHQDLETPETEEDLEQFAGYLTRFEITEHKRTTRDPEGFRPEPMNEIQTVQLALPLYDEEEREQIEGIEEETIEDIDEEEEDIE